MSFSRPNVRLAGGYRSLEKLSIPSFSLAYQAPTSAPQITLLLAPTILALEKGSQVLIAPLWSLQCSPPTTKSYLLRLFVPLSELPRAPGRIRVRAVSAVTQGFQLFIYTLTASCLPR